MAVVEWSLVFREEHQFKVSENRVVRKQLSNLNLDVTHI
jgi:hypothetical protein